MRKILHQLVEVGGEIEEVRTLYGKLVVKRRRATGKVARNSRRVNYAKAAKLRRQRQKRRDTRNAAR